MGKLRVLIVDDSKISRVMIAENLRDRRGVVWVGAGGAGRGGAGGGGAAL